MCNTMFQCLCKLSTKPAGKKVQPVTGMPFQELLAPMVTKSFNIDIVGKDLGESSGWVCGVRLPSPGGH